MRAFRCTGMRSVALAIGLMAAVGTGSPARGQPLVDHVESVEWMAVDSSVVVRGAIVALRIDPDGNGNVWHAVTFQVDETLKGPHRPMHRFVVWGNLAEKEIPRWKEAGRPVLAFLDESRFLVARGQRPYARFPLAPRTGQRKGSLIELDAAAGTPTYSLDLRPIRRPEEVLRAAKDAIATPSAPGTKPCDYSFMLPGLDLRNLTVPVDARLEARARQWARSDDKDLRRLGAAALVFFPSDANAEILRGLLDDPASWEHVIQEGVRLRRKRTYSVRWEASSVLQAWGYDVPRRPLQEPIEEGQGSR